MSSAKPVPAAGAAKPVTTIQALNMALEDAMQDDKNVLMLGEDVADREGGGVAGVTRGLSSKFGDKRVRSTPISEQAIVGAAIGAAIAGMKPVAEIMLMNFTTVCMDMIVNHAAKLRFMSGGQTGVPLTIMTMSGAGIANGGQHSDMLESWFAHVPGLKVVVPSGPAEAYGLLRSCIDDEDPCIFVEPIMVLFASGPAPQRGSRIPLGKANIVRQGTDVTVITYGKQLQEVMAAADALKDISVEVIDLRTIAPYDKETVLASVGKTKRAVIVHEAVKDFGVGAEIATQINESLFGKLAAPVHRVAGKFSPVPFARALETAFVPSKAEVEAAIRSACGKGGK
ncbi:MAG TPA: pyruvate dehydrogenase complex E1 component subunit beta [Steroidobacteraceae bacterium]|nr:pyruvate dehydrogenase complex E1 component subunit beta [Steroidobacteraceae bacterium]